MPFSKLPSRRFISRQNSAAVIEEVQLQCFKAKTKKPHAALYAGELQPFPIASNWKRESRKSAAAKYEPVKGHFPGADYPFSRRPN